MLSIRRISPMFRAIGTMGAVAAIVGGVTFANLSSSVTLTNDTLASATANLRISDDNVTYGPSAAGMNFSHLVPGATSSPFTFYINNNGDIPLNVTVQAPDATNGAHLNMNEITLSINCGGGAVTHTLDTYQASPQAIPGSPLSNAATWTCQATALLASTHTTSGDTLPAFTLSFVGNQ